MLELSTLQDLGALSKKLNIVNVSSSDVVTHGKIKQADDEFQSTCEKAIVIDNYQWIAVNDGDSIETAEIVYSCDGNKFIGSYNRKKRLFFQKELRDNKLYTVSQINLPNKEENSMADVNLTGLDDALKNMDLEGVSMPAAEATPAVSTRELSPAQQQIVALKEKVTNANVQLANNTGIALFNQRYGRVIGFVVKTDKGIKVSKTKVKKVDAQGNPMIRADLEPKLLANYEAKKNDPTYRVPASYCEKETAIVFKEARPSAPVAVIVATPKGGNIEYTRLYSGETLQAEQDTTLEIKIMNMELFYNFLAGLYDGRIKESEEVLGNRATWLMTKYSIAKKKNAAGIEETVGARASIALENRKDRATVITTGNYLPLRKYVSMSQSQIKTEEDAQALQLNIEAAFKNGGYDELRDADKKIIGTDGKTSDYFKLGGTKAIAGVTKFDEKGVEVSEIRVPVREKKPTKDGKGFTYGYKYDVLGDENSTLYKGDKSVENILKVAGFAVPEFLTEVAKVTKRTSSSAKSKISLTPQDFLAIKTMKGFETGTLSTKDIASQLAGLQ